MSSVLDIAEPIDEDMRHMLLALYYESHWLEAPNIANTIEFV